MTEFKIYRLHLPTGKVTTFTQPFNSQLHLLQTLNRWNYLSSLGPVVIWMYWTDI
jgi:hypothetical protein